MTSLERYDLPSEIMENVKGKLKFYTVLKYGQHIIIDKKLHVVTLGNGLMFQIVRDILGGVWAVYIGQK